MDRKIGVVRIRGVINIRKEIEDTFRKLKLYRKNSCAVIDNRKVYIGMLKKIKDYATWGEIDKETFKKLLLERGRIYGNKPINENYIKEKTKIDVDEFVNQFFDSKKKLKDIHGLKTFFRLKMPVNGFEKKGIKVPFSMGGVLGYRKDKINDLLKRMI